MVAIVLLLLVAQMSVHRVMVMGRFLLSLTIQMRVRVRVVMGVVRIRVLAVRRVMRLA